MPDDIPVVSPTLDVVEEAVETVEEPAVAAINAVEEAATDTIGTLSDALKIQAERLDAQQTTLGSVMSILNQINETVAGIATSAVEIPAEIAETVVEAPGEVAETVEATIEGNPEPPKHTRRRIGRKRR